MNKLIGIVFIVLVVVFFLYSEIGVQSPIAIIDNNNQVLDVELIQPPKIEKNKDTNKPQKYRSVGSESKSTKDEKDRGISQLLTKEGQSYKTLGEIMLESKDQAEKNRTYSPDLDAELKRAKYNLILAKEIARLSKSVSIPDGVGGTKLDEKIMEQMVELQKKLLMKVHQEQSKL